MSISTPVQRTLRDRARQVALFEIGGLVLSTPPFVWLSDVPFMDAAGLMFVLALIATLWNAAYNSGFDWIEGRLTGRQADRRPWPMRIAHALGFEGGILVLGLPVVMAWTGMGWMAALVADIGLALFYVVYAFFFNLAYDRAFPITATAR